MGGRPGGTSRGRRAGGGVSPEQAPGPDAGREGEAEVDQRLAAPGVSLGGGSGRLEAARGGVTRGLVPLGSWVSPLGEVVLALRAGADFSHEDGWCNAPPIFSFSSRRKRENGPCTVQKRKRSIRPAGDEGRGGAASAGYASLQSAAWCGRGFWWLMQGLFSLPRCR